MKDIKEKVAKSDLKGRKRDIQDLWISFTEYEPTVRTSADRVLSGLSGKQELVVGHATYKRL